MMGQSGTAFRDFNGDGLQTGAEPGVEGVIVKLYANAALPAKDILIGETVTGVGGAYDFSTLVVTGRAANPGENIRLEFDIPSDFECGLEGGVDFTGYSGETYGSSVQFAAGQESNLNFAINYPGQWVSTPDPITILPCYVFGTANGGVANSPALVQYNYLDNGVPAAHSSGQAGVDQAELVSTISEVGALYGVAFSRSAQKAFTSAVMRRHAAFGPLGPGGIYLVDPFSPNADKTEDWLNLDAIGIATSDPVGPYPANPGNNTSPVSGYIGTDVERGLNVGADQPSTDYAAGDQVGKVSLGDIDISDDGRYLYVVNLYDRRVYEIDLVNPQNPEAPTLANVATRVRSWPVPDPATLAMHGEERPWGLKYYRGKLYVGLVLSGQDINGDVVSPVSGAGDGRVGDGLLGYVFEFDPVAETFTERLSFDFDYGRERAWIPWGYSGLSGLSRYFAGTEREVAAPIIADIEFDDQGSMLIGILDRKGNQYAINNNNYNGVLVNYEYASAGELLRADVSYSGNSCVYNIVTRPGTSDFYNDNLLHPESVQGGLAVLPGAGDVMAVWLDPILIRSGGTIRLNNQTGAQVPGSAYEVFDDRFTVGGNPNQTAAPSKANGLGDVEVGGDPAGIEIGNLVWADYDEDGIQDSGEPGIPNVTVELWSGDDATMIASTVTNSEGGYYFNQTNIIDGDPATPGNQPGLLSFSNYKLYVRATQYGNGQPLGGFEPTLLDQVGIGKVDFSDHDGVEQGNGDLQIMLTIGRSGENNHTYDYGLQCVYEAGASFIPVPAGCDGLTELNDGYIVLASFNTGTDRYGISPGAGAYAGPMFDAATAVPALGESILENVSNAGGTFVIRVYAGNELCFQDYTVIVPPRTCPADPAGYIYCEDSGEIITGGSIQVIPPAGGNVLITKDGSDGTYEFFNDGTDGVYTIVFTAPTGYALSTTCNDLGQLNPGPGDPNPFILGADDADNDGFLDNALCANNSFYLEFFLETGDQVLLNNIPLSCGKIGDYVWEDNNLDGVQDGNEPGVQNIQVVLYECAGGVKGAELGTTTTDAQGAYCFTGLPGDVEYCVEFDLVNSTNPFADLYAFTAQDQMGAGVDDTNDSDADPANGCTTSVLLTPGQQYEDFDAGLTLVDLGDLPEDTGYNTTIGNGGPVHSVPSSGAIVKIGTVVDIELDGQPSPDADGDGDDEDGFDPNAQMFIRTQAQDLTIPVMNMTGGPAKLTMFVDWNNDGVFEAMYTDQVEDGETTA
ncbi:SdrD B-like domain-containing protein, partial [Lewinella cohaerens]|uniref:SdrD B-like domain-containing protein n=1 Tax=Lewinella cohaerens TaxID=70995 RepID=UPI0005C68A47